MDEQLGPPVLGMGSRRGRGWDTGLKVRGGKGEWVERWGGEVIGSSKSRGSRSTGTQKKDPTGSTHTQTRIGSHQYTVDLPMRKRKSTMNWRWPPRGHPLLL